MHWRLDSLHDRDSRLGRSSSILAFSFRTANAGLGQRDLASSGGGHLVQAAPYQSLSLQSELYH